jgi:hypothetical protein
MSIHVGNDSSGTRRELKVNGKTFSYYSLDAAEKAMFKKSVKEVRGLVALTARLQGAAAKSTAAPSAKKVAPAKKKASTKKNTSEKPLGEIPIIVPEPADSQIDTES